jgi:hypothetical protein
MLEIKYLKTQARAADIERAFGEAFEQLDRHASDQALVPLLTQGKELKVGALVFVGAKDVLFRPWPSAPRAARKAARKKAAPGPKSGRRRPLKR